jgi:1-deoxyxylulose-5-phosphate synthase
MQYVRLGGTGLEVSRICLGCMTFAMIGRGHRPWTLDEENSRPIIRQALELGVNFFDTANVYAEGSSEEITGRALKDFARREEVVIATKVHGRMRPGANGAGLSRKVIMAEIDASLKRLGTDYVDLYQIHRFDPKTPIEETLEALHDVVRSGKARYIGASSMHAWQFAKMLYTSRLNGWTRFVSMQNHLNLLNREEEREMLPLCADQSVGVIPWSPLARGRLSRSGEESSKRQDTDAFGKNLYMQFESDQKIIEAVGVVAAARRVPRAQIALAWLLQKAPVTAPIIGASRPNHLPEAVAAVELKLTAEEIQAIEAPYATHTIAGYQ